MSTETHKTRPADNRVAPPSWLRRYGSQLGIILAAGYMLSLYRHTMLGAVRHPVNLTLPDLNPREWLIVTPLLVWSVAIGIYPAPYFALLSRPVEQILERLHP